MECATLVTMTAAMVCATGMIDCATWRMMKGTAMVLCAIWMMIVSGTVTGKESGCSKHGGDDGHEGMCVGEDCVITYTREGAVKRKDGDN